MIYDEVWIGTAHFNEIFDELVNKTRSGGRRRSLNVLIFVTLLMYLSNLLGLQILCELNIAVEGTSDCEEWIYSCESNSVVTLDTCACRAIAG